MLWKSLHHFDIMLYMSFPTIEPPREQDQAIMDIILSLSLNSTDITHLNRCCIYLQALFLSGMTTADRKYLEHFVFELRGSYITILIYLPMRTAILTRLGPMDQFLA